VELVRRRRIIRASFSQERMTYIAAQDSSDGLAKVIYQSKDAKTTKTKILRHFGLLETHNHDSPIGNASDISEFIIDYDYSQVAPMNYWLQ